VLFRSVFAAAALSLSAPALAQLPEPLEQALSAVPNDASPEALVLRMTLSGQSVRIAVSFAEDGPRYRLIEPASEALLSDAQADMWAGFSGNEDEAAQASETAEAETANSEDDGSHSIGFGDYDPEELRTAIGETATLLREEEGRLIYEFTPQTLPGQSDTPDAMIENLRGEVEVDPALGQLAAIRFVLAESFKPNMAARVNEFRLEQRFVNEPALEGPRMAGVSMTMAGSSLFQPFAQTMRLDIEEARFPQGE
jgi:hypothetical protein